MEAKEKTIGETNDQTGDDVMDTISNPLSSPRGVRIFLFMAGSPDGETRLPAIFFYE